MITKALEMAELIVDRDGRVLEDMEELASDEELRRILNARRVAGRARGLDVGLGARHDGPGVQQRGIVSRFETMIADTGW
ncbi:MAG: hypothetical protein ACRD1K_19975 [Acidimicrobiales bacterium]